MLILTSRNFGNKKFKYQTEVQQTSFVFPLGFAKSDMRKIKIELHKYVTCLKDKSVDAFIGL